MTELINIFFLVVAALFPIVNPLGNVPIVIRLTQRCTPEIRHALARRIAVGGFLLLLGSVLLGSHILVFFGITLPVVRVAGGLVVTVMGWRLLNQGDNPIENQAAGTVQDASILDQSFYPMTMPLTVGPGSIATSIALGSQRPIVLADFSHFVLQAGAAIVGLMAIAVSIYLSYRFAERIERMLGRTGTNVLMRLSAFILVCIGMQIIWNGISSLLNIQQG
jgi:multiple antibiotic resistance protein